MYDLFSINLFGQSIQEIWKAEQQERIGQPMNDFRIISLNKDTVYSKQLEGKITLFDFWEYHCSPCRANLKPLDELYNRLKEYPDFQFLSIASVERKGVSSLVKEYELSYEVYTVWEDLIKKLIIHSSYPTVIITDRKGEIIYFERGGFRKEDEAREGLIPLEKKLIELLNE
ncbi:MAG: TlpA family protein disulfide reductase [Tannerellaceae bacterium]|nr:TlpA family protein disulfide reductase [Tannerellaceae bacterium]